MTLDAQSALRKSLDDVTRLHKRIRVLFIVLFFILMICIFWLGRVSESHPVDIPKLVVAAMLLRVVLQRFTWRRLRIASTPHEQEGAQSD